MHDCRVCVLAHCGRFSSSDYLERGAARRGDDRLVSAASQNWSIHPERLALAGLSATDSRYGCTSDFAVLPYLPIAPTVSFVRGDAHRRWFATRPMRPVTAWLAAPCSAGLALSAAQLMISGCAGAAARRWWTAVLVLAHGTRYPPLDVQFFQGTSRIDADLLIGSVGGIGWGMAGQVPVQRLPAGSGRWEIALFVAAMAAGMALRSRFAELARGVRCSTRVIATESGGRIGPLARISL